ncbi:protein-tyrosine sulfotransferase 1-like [Lampetra fluviatilis]
MRGSSRHKLLVACGLAAASALLVLYLGQQALECQARGGPGEARGPEDPRWLGWDEPAGKENTRSRDAMGVHRRQGLVVFDPVRREFRYNESIPIIFIGGFPRSGTTLMRVMLDAHSQVRCGEETRVVPRVLGMHQMWMKSEKERVRLAEAGVTDAVLDDAVRAFVLEIVAKHGEPAQRLCNKDPFALKSLSYLATLFPESRFLLMLRDGRASVHSMISRRVTVSGFDLSSYRDCLSKWSRAVEGMHAQCLAVGPRRCMAVRYETLALRPEATMREALAFLGLPWEAAVLHHEDMIGKAGGVSLSKVERSTDQVVKPVNLEALARWVGQIPHDVVRDMAEVAPMLDRLGYDPRANPPRYGTPESRVVDNTRKIKQRNATAVP